MTSCNQKIRRQEMKTCTHCHRELPLEQFELYPTGTRRRVCRHCHYVLHTQAARRRWVMRQLARALRIMETEN